MDKKENIIRMNPQFIRLKDGSLMNINNIVAISEDDSKVFVLGYQRIPITEEDMAAVLGNIEIIDDDGHQHHCGQDAGECKVSCGELEATVPCEYLLGMQVISAGGSKTRCVGCPRETDSCFKTELVGGGYICLAKPHKEEPKRPVISFDEDEHKVFTHNGNCDVSRRINEKNLSTYQEALDDAVQDVKAHGATHFSCPLAVLVAQREIEVDANPMQEIKRKADDFMAYLDNVVKG